MHNQKLLDSLTGTEIAVVGMAGRFPDANNIETFWQNLRDGKEAIRTYTDAELRNAGVSETLLQNPDYVKVGAPIDTIEMFDASFFGFSPRDAAIMDPQHRHFLEVCWEGLEHAGYDPTRYEGAIGVYGGSGHNAYLPYHLLTNPELLETVGFFLLRHTGNDKDFLTTRVSYLLDLRGPSVNVQTACSTSLVAIHFGVQSLLNQECDMVLAGGVTFELPHRQGYLYQEGEILAPDGHCRAFDADAEGTVFGSGAGVVVLKRLEDAIQDGDTIHSVILGSAINNDGAGKVNYLAPSVDGQAGAIAEAIELAGISADTISYVETHGTGTRIGDPIEVQALTQAFRNSSNGTQYCGIGSAKTNIGHLDTAAGIAGFIKTTQALKHKQLPPSLNFSSPNPMIDFENSPFYVNSKLQDWETNGDPRRAGISSLGVGGTNAHIILEEAPELDETDVVERPFTLLPLSAKTQTALNNATANLVAYLKSNPNANLADVAYTLQLGRQQFDQRRILAVRDTTEAIEVLESGQRKRLLSQKIIAENPSVVFMFPGGGAQYPNMGRDLYETEPVYRKQIDSCLELLKRQLDVDLKSLMFPAPGDEDAAAKALQKPSLSLPAVFMTELALAKLWLSWGIEPVAMTGHSMGEYTAACLAGVLSVADALSIVTLRGKLFETLPEGGMISVPLPEAEVVPLLVDGANVAVINSPGMCVVSGRVEAIEKMEVILAEKEVESRRVKIRVAAHSAMLGPILDEFKRHLQQITFMAPKRPFISNVTGTWADPTQVVTPQYWVTHLRQTVRFGDGLSLLMQDAGRIFLEVGPGQTLTSLARQQPAKQKNHEIISSMRHRNEDIADDLFAYNSLGRLWLAGFPVPWQDYYKDEYRRRIPLPTYPFDHQRYWIEPGMQLGTAVIPPQPTLSKLKNLDDWFYQPKWEQTDPVPDTSQDKHSYLIFADELGIGHALAEKLTAASNDVVVVHPGAIFTQTTPHHFHLSPDNADDYRQLLSALTTHKLFPDRILHFWTVNKEAGVASNNQDLGFYSLLYLAQALGTEDTNNLQIRVFTNGSQQIQNEPVTAPEKATLLGPVKVIPQEMPHIATQLIDIQLPTNPKNEPFLTTLIAEIQATIAQNVTAYRDGQRWEQQFVPGKLSPKTPTIPIAQDGNVYLITGGLGGIALIMAENLAQQAQVKLVLISRSGLPERSEWDNWLQHAGKATKTNHLIQQVRALEATGAEVMVAQADITNREQMTQLLQTVRQKWGAINGVIHAAGVLNDGLIQLKTHDEAAQVLQPKVTGTLLLDDLLANDPLDFFVSFSSTSSVLGPAGQVDYVAANAFLNAFAQSRNTRGLTPTIAINWGVWQEVGMAARAARGDFAEPSGALMVHPLLDRLVTDSEDVIEYITDYRVADFWLLDQHRLKNNDALIPGTGYLEIVKAALTKGGIEETVEIRDLIFMHPLSVDTDETRRVKVRLENEADAYSFTISSQSSLSRDRDMWTEHVQGRVAKIEATLPIPLNHEEILARCQEREVRYGSKEQETQQEAYLNFGPRWKNLRQMNFGDGEALAYLELPSEFSADTEAYRTHPALMDLATSFALPLLPDYGSSEAFYVPFMYRQVVFYAPLPDKIYSHARLRVSSSPDMPEFDVVIYDEEKRPLIDIHGFTLKKVDPTDLTETKTAVYQADESPSLLDLSLTEGILPHEGVEAFNRILSGNSPSQIIVSSLDLALLMAQTKERAISPEDHPKNDGLKLARPDLQSDYVAPSSDVEKAVVAIWEKLLGINDIGIEDDFFELGGHSLLAIRFITQIRKAFGVEIALRDIFNQPTTAELAPKIEQMLTTHDEASEGNLAIIPIQRKAYLPLSFSQERLWFLEKLNPGHATYNVPTALLIKGTLDMGALTASAQALVNRHESLRTAFTEVDSEAVGILQENAPIDIKHLSPELGEETAVHEFLHRLFDLGNAPLMRLGVFVRSADECILLLSIHHIVADGWSVGILVRELLLLYQAYTTDRAPSLPDLPIQFADYAHWQHAQLTPEKLADSINFWQTHLSNAPALLELPTDFPRPSQMSSAGDNIEFLLPAELVQSLRNLCATSGTTLYMVLLAAFQTLLYRYSQQLDLVIGSPIANRERAEIEEVIGYFTNTLAIRTQIDPEMSFEALLAQIRTTTLDVLAYQQTPFGQVVEALNPERNQSYNPIYQVLFALQNMASDVPDIAGLDIEVLPVNTDTALMDMFLEIREGQDNLMSARLEFNTSLFARETAVQLCNQLIILLTEIAHAPTTAVNRINLLSNKERARILETWNETAVVYDTRPTPTLIEAQAKNTPEATALRYKGQVLSYQQLDQRANQVARTLQSWGVAQNTLVGLGMERSLDAIIALLGIWKAGGAYVPLDPAYPQARLRHMVKDSGMPLLITDIKNQTLFAEFGVKTMIWEETEAEIKAQTTSTLSLPLDNRHRAYVIYTSGSTGLPKGVQVPHQALTNFLWSMQKEPGLSADDVLASVTTFSFDIHGLELWLPLITGAEVVIVPSEIGVDGIRLAQLLDTTNTTLLQATPATWKLLIDSGWNGRSQLKMLCGGEPLPQHLADQLLERGKELWNMYGPTETTIWSSLSKVKPSPSQITIGHPIANTQLFVLDKQMQPVPVGVTGELYIGGDGVTLGYLNRPELTAEKFVSNPFGTGIIYNTGDLARYTHDGELICLGRVDHQVKVRGFRIELGEIETILTTHPLILDAAIIVREDEVDDKRIVAYFISESEPDPATLRDHMAQSLPYYMVPATFMQMDAFPLTPNGKVAHKNFPRPDYSEAQATTQFVAPETEMELLLAKIWADVLNIEQISVNDNFFDIGGHSLLAIRIFDQIYQATGERMPLATLFQTTTIAGLAVALENEAWQTDSAAIVTIAQDSRENVDELPLYFVIPPGDELLVLYDLAQELGEKRPFLGLQYGNNGERPFTNVQDMAAYFVDQILDQDAQGPYLLGGYCFGGLVAYEMTQQLQKRGKEISLLTLVDTFVPGAVTEGKTSLSDMVEKSISILKEDGLSAEVQHIVNRTTDRFRLGVWRPLWSKLQAQYIKKEQALPDTLRDFDFINDLASDKYQIQPYAGNTVLIQPETRLPTYQYAPHLGWDQFIQGTLTDHTIPGDHRGLLDKPYVIELAAKIEDAIAQAIAESSINLV